MGFRVCLAFGMTPESWLNQQSQYDLWMAKKHIRQLKVKKLYEAA